MLVKAHCYEIDSDFAGLDIQSQSVSADILLGKNTTTTFAR